MSLIAALGVTNYKDEWGTDESGSPLWGEFRMLFFDPVSGESQLNAIGYRDLIDWASGIGLDISADRLFRPRRYIYGVGVLISQWFWNNEELTGTYLVPLLDHDVADRYSTESVGFVKISDRSGLCAADEQYAYFMESSGTTISLYRCPILGGPEEVAYVTGCYRNSFTHNNTAPELWRNGDRYRMLVTLTNSASSRRGASREFGFSAGGSSVGMDTNRRQPSNALRYGVELAGYFYGYQPVPVTPGSGFVYGPDIHAYEAASNGFSCNHLRRSGGVVELVTSATYAGSSTGFYNRVSEVVGAQIVLDDLRAFDGYDGRSLSLLEAFTYEGVFPPYIAPAVDFWTGLVYAREG